MVGKARVIQPVHLVVGDFGHAQVVGADARMAQVVHQSGGGRFLVDVYVIEDRFDSCSR